MTAVSCVEGSKHSSMSSMTAQWPLGRDSGLNKSVDFIMSYLPHSVKLTRTIIVLIVTLCVDLPYSGRIRF